MCGSHLKTITSIPEEAQMKKNRKSPIVSLITILSLMLSMCSGILLTDRAAAQTTNTKRTDKKTATSSFTRNLTELARDGKLEAGAANPAITPVVDILSDSQQNNPVLISESSINANAVIQLLAQRIATGDVPGKLRNTEVFALDVYGLLAGAKSGREIQRRVEAVLAQVSREKNSILFVDELHQFVGERAYAEVSETLKQAIAARKLRVVGSTSRTAYNDYIGSDAMLDGLFKQVDVDTTAETSEEQAEERGGFKGQKISPDVTEIIQGASTRKRASVILQVQNTKSAELADLLQRNGGRITSSLNNLGVIQVELPVGAIETVASSRLVQHVSADKQVRAFGHVTATTGADQIRNQTTTTLLGGTTSYTLDGSGIGIAIVDSGIDTNHKSFLGNNGLTRVVYSKDFTGENRVDDPYGHGSHVASIAAGNGRIANAKYLGVAPNANLVNLRVLNKTGVGSVASLLGALNWLMANHTTYNIKVVNMSLGMLAVDSYKNDPVCKAVRSLVDAGVVVVAAAGNNGKNTAGQKLYGHIHSPGIEPSAITVGATNTYGTDRRADDVMTTYSSRCPTRGFW